MREAFQRRTGSARLNSELHERIEGRTSSCKVSELAATRQGARGSNWIAAATETERAEAIFEMCCTGEKQSQRDLWIFQPFDVCEKTARLDREHETRWNLTAPMLERCFTRETVKTAIDLHGLKLLRKEWQPLRWV